MYYIGDKQDNHCLDYFVSFEYQWMEQFISYCFRSSVQSSRILYANFNNTADHHFTFKMLYERNITSQELLQWSSTIDLAERYQIYIEDAKNVLSFEDEQFLFYNCSWPWFGPFCQFAFDDPHGSFNVLISSFFLNKILAYDNSMITCYAHLQCETLLTCLDWRDICDGKMDCLDGTDEFDCWPLEMNQCNAKEYRCHNGQCIPEDFLLDDDVYSDCLDRSDEPINREFSWSCFQNPSFPCEERTCRPGIEEFSCGDGQCISEMGRTCFNGKGHLLSNDSCLDAMSCLMKSVDSFDNEECNQICSNTNCISDYCPILFEFPAEPVLFGHVRLIFETEKIINNIFLPSYVCYNEELCQHFLPITIYLNGSACRHIDQFNRVNNIRDFKSFITYLKSIFRPCAVVPIETYDCNHKNAYKCMNSTKCISKYRLVDGIQDCPYHDDEKYNESCELDDKHHRFQCFNDEKRCLARSAVGNGYSDCPERDDEEPDNMFTKQHIYFQTICNGNQELIPVMVDGQNETDETECQFWPCNSTYNRCNQFWSCYNGVDEINCKDSICPSFQHTCVFSNDHTKLQCLSLNRTGDGIIDCLGASDERQYCRMLHPNEQYKRFYCSNDTKCIATYKLCDGIRDCKFGDDEQFCTNNTISLEVPLCNRPTMGMEERLCSIIDVVIRKKVYFTTQNIPIYPQSLTNNITKQYSIDIQNPMLKSKLNIGNENDEKQRCNRGLDIRVRMNDNGNESYECLCPPSYYGDTCQYQNERVSVSFELRVASDRRTLFVVLILLIDHEGKVHSHDQIEYLPVEHCHTKFHVYLLYSTRPRDNTKNYSVRIDIFNKLTLNYRASWIFPVLFPFLPVYPLAIQLTIPLLSVQSTQHCPLSCIHGQCLKYTNAENAYFCRCNHGWSGNQCSIAYQCNCSSDSLCIDQSICLCPVTKFGSLCYLTRIACERSLCFNNGLCVPNDARHEISDGLKSSYSCICTENFEGDRCEFRKTRLDISFGKKIAIPESLFIHFIETFKNSKHSQTTIMKRVSPYQTELTVYTTTEFEVALAQIRNSYYLIVLRELSSTPEDISTQITISQKCVSIRQLFNTTIANQHLLRRIKRYHIPCQQQNELVCFHDDVYFCLCDYSRYANCFEFNFNITYDCHGLNPCENGGHCSQDKRTCPTSVICACDTCFYGTRCQFSTQGFHPSLDGILGYQIRPNLALSQQSIAVKVSIVLTITIFILGIINGFLLMMTFRRKQTRNIGCDLYLFISSIISLIMMHIFLLKTCFLILIQMNLITNRLFILLQCRSVDFIIRSFISISDWLHACIAIERIMVLKEVSFNKKRSKEAAKWIIGITILVVTCTNTHEPLYRHLIDDDDEQRTWCAIRLSSLGQVFDSTINLLHFLLPFSINVISALVIIVITARTRSNVQRKQTYKEHLYQQLEKHKHLLVSPCILIVLASPRLIISLTSECMKSVRDPWLFLSGYFVSFFPSIVTFPVFVLPSQVYKGYFSQSIQSLHCR
ncbi:unnamed protein product [Adineta ricciae]|uniref:Uncharacterized protein n=1 Tax=Adineta ricciae TaxID=249248 RepID=A0A816AVF7_ADIRI|nr:unnamed protein product [Adineta ricciae]CAF1602315.1 unnamed protein product [Adineta ricciae]